MKQIDFCAINRAEFLERTRGLVNDIDIPSILKDFEVKRIIPGPCRYRIDMKSVDCYLFVAEDEYFIIHVTFRDSIYYKCDQVRGLLNCMEYIQKVFNK